MEENRLERTADHYNENGAGLVGSDPAEDELILCRAFHRVMRAIMFDEPPHPELDILPLAQLRLLWTVFFVPDATMKVYSERLHVSQSTLSQLADRLVGRGLVERHPDPVDRRSVRMRLSDDGRRILEEADGRQRDTFRHIWEMLSANDRTAVLRCLGILAEAAEQKRMSENNDTPPWTLSSSTVDGVDPSTEEPAQPVFDLMARRVRGGSSR